MSLVSRTLTSKLLKLFSNFPVVTLTGPRQSGKSTLVQAAFPDLPYVNLEDLNSYQFALTDPVSFIGQYKNGAIIDEIQRVPELFSAIQVEVDRQKKKSLFVLSGSQNFLLLEKVAQSLAGRVAILHLLPYSLTELKAVKSSLTLDEFIFLGGYPRVHSDRIPIEDWMPSYIQTYVERDVRSLKNIGDLPTFQRFMRLCAARVGNLIDFTGIGNDLGISHNTVRAWVNILETSFIVYLLQPHYQNFNKRLVKTPKLYFYDTGLACSLLGIRNPNELQYHSQRGALFECAMLNEIKKYYFHQGLESPMYFWRDRKAEIDCLLEKNIEQPISIEIKSGRTLSPDQMKSLEYWLNLSGQNAGHLIYAGDQKQRREQIDIWPWNQVNSLMDAINSPAQLRSPLAQR